MCTILKGPTKARVGYKVVGINVYGSAYSPLNSYDWYKGRNCAKGQWEKNRKGKSVWGGAFHFFATKLQARIGKRVLSFERDCRLARIGKRVLSFERDCRLAIIKCKLDGIVRRGIHSMGYKEIDNKVAYLATQAIWDGKFIR